MSYAKNIGMRFLLWSLSKLYRRPKFGKFLITENIKDKIVTAAKRREKQFPDLVNSYISAAFSFPIKLVEHFRWDFSFSIFLLGLSIYTPTIKLPILKAHSQKVDRDAWDYEGRIEFLYPHILAKCYGWTVDYVGTLSIDTALAFVQEVITDEQLEKEFYWAMSDRSYIYNPKTKSGKPNPLDRPYFMREKIEEPKKVSYSNGVLPPGVDYSSIPPEFRPR